ncbi:SAM-MT-RSMB-NOP domain-containing protein [Mycena chlorophos]|uniref:SAM-MT-RSMB-NOP domain-containing protein n=1 Tax=Mycena chlorophos TaxID=658473 RepID=A0A8H6TTQ5_MYCCL|nr:SAM-MT-RSMB-NOP domain-containing protein [Mycena chlorophos]
MILQRALTSRSLVQAFYTLRLQAARPRSLRAIGTVGLGLGLALARSPVYCEGSRPTSPVPPAAPKTTPESDAAKIPPPPVPESSVNMLELSFGTVAGICAGVFIKKGAKMVAFVLGGIFVFLQYTGSVGLVKVDWNAVGVRFKRAFYTIDAKGEPVAPTVYSVWFRLVHFLTADFQPRASFLAGLVLGLRIG